MSDFHRSLDAALDRGRMSAWVYADEQELDESLPPDLSPLNPKIFGLTFCDARGGGGTGDWMCTRIADHTGRHAAGDGTSILAVWP